MLSLPFARQLYASQIAMTTTAPHGLSIPIVIPKMGDNSILSMLLGFQESCNDHDHMSTRNSTESEPDIATSPPATPDSPGPFDFKLVCDIPEVDIMAKMITSMSAASIKKVSKRDTPSRSSEQRIKRPMNAFMVWSQQRRQQLAASGSKQHNSDISKMLGAEWRLLAEEQKVPFVERAKQLREEHFLTYPDYVYRPRRRKRIVKSSGSLDSVVEDEGTSSKDMATAILEQISCYMKVIQKAVMDSNANIVL